MILRPVSIPLRQSWGLIAGPVRALGCFALLVGLAGCAGDAPTPAAPGAPSTPAGDAVLAPTAAVDSDVSSAESARGASPAGPDGTSPAPGSTLAGESFAPTDTPEPTPTDMTASEAAPVGTTGCIATADDGLGPNYEPGAPERSSVGSGYKLEGLVLEAGTCRALTDAVVEIWMAGPDGVYTDAHRATVPVDRQGAFDFESHRPAGYATQPAHIHLRVSAPGHAPVAIRHLIDEGATSGTVAAVLARQ